MKKLIMLLACLSSSFLHAFEFPQVSQQWLREAPPNANMLAAYAIINNKGNEDLIITGAFAPDFGMAEIHKTVEVDGMLRMREQKQLTLNAYSEILMEPGGIHIMLMMPEQRFTQGDTVRICLVYLDNTGKEQVQHLDFPVKKQ